MPINQIDYTALQRDAQLKECNRCGKCCRLPSGRYCPNLGKRNDGLTYCRIWNRAGRIGTFIGEGQVCSNVAFVPRLWKDCPYNEVKIKHGIVPKDAPVED